MNNRIMFMIVNQELQYSNDNSMDHRDWYTKLGYPIENYENIVRGFIMDDKIIFFKGSNFQYDEEVINSACLYAPKIRENLNNPSLKVYCGIIVNSQGEKWEPVLNIQESELLTEAKEVKEPVMKPQTPTNTGPIVEFKNNYDDDKFIKRAILVTIVVLLLTIILKVYLFSKKTILHMGNTMDMLLVFAQIGLLALCIYGYKVKSASVKYLGIAASICIVLSFDLFDIIIGIFYFLFTIDQEYIISMKNGAGQLINKIRKK